MPDLSDTIETLAAAPASVSAGDTSVSEQPIGEVIKADQYLAQKDAAEKVHRGLRFTKLKPPGAA